MSNFNKDLKDEQILCEYLDDVYDSLDLKYKRKSDMDSQYKGIDLTMEYQGLTDNVDEKAQLHYLNTTLPTFAFELSYLKYGVRKSGWLLDAKKKTELYFLIRGITLKDGKDKLTKKSDIVSVDITCVDRFKLLSYLFFKKGLTYHKLKKYDKYLRKKKLYKGTEISELHYSKEGKIYFTEYLKEKPINLVLKIDFLISIGVAEKII